MGRVVRKKEKRVGQDARVWTLLYFSTVSLAFHVTDDALLCLESLSLSLSWLFACSAAIKLTEQGPRNQHASMTTTLAHSQGFCLSVCLFVCLFVRRIMS